MGKFHDQAQAVPVFGDVSDTGCAARLAIGVSDIDFRALDAHIAGPGRDTAKDAKQLRLSVAGDAGDAENLPGPDIERDLFQSPQPVSVGHREVFDIEKNFARLTWLLVDPEKDLSPDHQFGEFFG